MIAADSWKCPWRYAKKPLGKAEIERSPGFNLCAIRRNRRANQLSSILQFLICPRHKQTGPTSSVRDVRITGLPEAFEQFLACPTVFVISAKIQAQFCVSVPGIMFGGIGAQGCSPQLPDFFTFASMPEPESS